MTVKEMDSVIQKQCNADCKNCKIKPICYSICGDFESNPIECKRAYDLLMGIDNQVIHPSHYNQGGIECIDAMVAAFGKEAVATWCKLNAFKYVWREQHKNGMQDIDKAVWYLNKYKELKASGE